MAIPCGILNGHCGDVEDYETFSFKASGILGGVCVNVKPRVTTMVFTDLRPCATVNEVHWLTVGFVSHDHRNVSFLRHEQVNLGEAFMPNSGHVDIVRASM